MEYKHILFGQSNLTVCLKEGVGVSLELTCIFFSK